MLQNEVIQAILNRRSIRAYTDQPLTREELETVLECGLWAPSGMNQQTTRLVAIESREMLDLLAQDDIKFMAPPPPMAGKAPGGPMPPAGDRPLAYGAPCVILIFDTPEMGGKTINAPLCEENICLAAHSLGLGTCILGGMGAFNDPENAAAWKARLGLPEEYQYITCVAIGHPAGAGTPSPRKEGRIIIQ